MVPCREITLGSHCPTVSYPLPSSLNVWSPPSEIANPSFTFLVPSAVAPQLQDECLLGTKLSVPVSASLPFRLEEDAEEALWVEFNNCQATSRATPNHHGNALSDLSPGPLRIYRRKVKTHTRNTYVADFTWFIRISQVKKTYFHHIVQCCLLPKAISGHILWFFLHRPLHHLATGIRYDPVRYCIFS